VRFNACLGLKWIKGRSLNMFMERDRADQQSWVRKHYTPVMADDDLKPTVSEEAQGTPSAEELSANSVNSEQHSEPRMIALAS
jgi:hypothetical protein